MNIQTNDTTGEYVTQGGPSAIPRRKGWTNRDNVVAPPAHPVGDTTSVLRYPPTGWAWVAPAVTLASLAAALNAELTTIFETAPIEAQIAFSNLAGPTGAITRLINAGQLAAAKAGLQGMVTAQLVPSDYAAFITPAVAAIAGQEAAFAALTPTPTSTT